MHLPALYHATLLLRPRRVCLCYGCVCVYVRVRVCMCVLCVNVCVFVHVMCVLCACVIRIVCAHFQRGWTALTFERAFLGVNQILYIFRLLTGYWQAIARLIGWWLIGYCSLYNFGWNGQPCWPWHVCLDIWHAHVLSHHAPTSRAHSTPKIQHTIMSWNNIGSWHLGLYVGQYLTHFWRPLSWISLREMAGTWDLTNCWVFSLHFFCDNHCS